MGWLRKILGRAEPEPEPPPMELDPELLALLEEHGLRASDRQLRFADFIGDPDWTFDQGTGQLRLGDREFAAQIVGSTSYQSGTWLWSWANPSIEEPLTARAREARRIGEERGIALLTTPSIDMETIGDAHLMAFAIAGLLDADAYYRCPHDAGELIVLLEVPEVRAPTDLPELRAITVIPQSAGMPGLLTARSIANYLRWLGLDVTETAREVRIGDGTSGRFTFDAPGRLTEMKGRVQARPD